MMIGNEPSHKEYIESENIASAYMDDFVDHPLFSTDSKVLFRWVFPGKESLVDLGCGCGRHMQLLRGYCKNLTGIDASLAMLNEARKTLGDKPMLIQGDIADPSWFFQHHKDSNGKWREVEKFNDLAICMFNVIGFCLNDGRVRSVFTTASWLTYAAGEFVLHFNTPKRVLNTWSGRWAWFKSLFNRHHVIRLKEYRGIKNMATRCYSLRKIKKLLADTGWQVVETVKLDKHCQESKTVWPDGYILRCNKANSIYTR